MEEKPPMQKQSFAYILGWSQEKIAGQNRNLVNAVTLLHTLLYTILNSPDALADVHACLCLLPRLCVTPICLSSKWVWQVPAYKVRI